MFQEKPVLGYSQAPAIDGRSRAFVKIALNVLLVAALVVVLGPGRQLFYADMGAAQQARAVARLLKAFQEHLARLGVVGKPPAGSEQILLVGPPNGTLFEGTEEITLRWSHNLPLKTGQSYRVVVAYYAYPITPSLNPTFRYFSAKRETLQLPSLSPHPSLPFFVWAVHVADDGSNAPTGVASATYRVLYFVRPNIMTGYSWDMGL